MGNREGPNNPDLSIRMYVQVESDTITTLCVSLVEEHKKQDKSEGMDAERRKDSISCWVCSSIEPPIAERHDGW